MLEVRLDADDPRKEKWQVIAVAKTGLTNREAWRFVDRAGNEPINRREDLSDWIFFTTLLNGGR